ncbi:MAG: TldD/PmbA family protein [Candidatus Kariarchaeaceae archaeon]
MRDILQEMIDQANVLLNEFLDIRYQDRSSTTIVLHEGIIESAKTAIESGIIARAYINGQWGYASSRVLTKEDISQTLSLALKSARFLGKGVNEPTITINHPIVTDSEVKVEIDPKEVSIEEKIKTIKDMTKVVSSDKRIISSTFTYLDSLSQEIIVNSEGTNVSTFTPHISLASSVVASDENKALSYSSSEAKTMGYEFFEKNDFTNTILPKLVDHATHLLSSKKLSRAIYDVVIDPSLAGMIAHEAIGHTLNPKISPQLIHSMNNVIASEEISLVDDPTIPGANGSYTYDGEGIKSEKRYLIKDGVLNTLLYDLEIATRYNVSSNGAARVFIPLEQPSIGLSNTFISPKDASLEELFAECNNGLYLIGSVGGYAFNNGSFAFQAQEGIIIKDGELVEEESYHFPEITGWNHEFLNNVQLVGKDFKMGNGSFCDKQGSLCPIEVGGSSLSIKQLYIGGD